MHDRAKIETTEKTVKRAIRKIVVTGPESSGKTLLAQAIATRFQTPWAPEFARYYVANLGRPYSHNDLAVIYQGQKNWETWFLQHMFHSPAPPFLVCDTDWTVLRIWEQYGYPATASVLPTTDEWELAKDTYYLLCTPDFPWQPDPLREHPEERWQLFELYRNLLEERHLPFLTVTGSLENRLEQVAETVPQFFPSHFVR